MKRVLIIILSSLYMTVGTIAQNVTVNAVNQPAAGVFRSLMEQTGMNFVYSSELLEGVRVTVKASDRPLEEVLDNLFDKTDIEYKIMGNNVILKRIGKRVKGKRDRKQATVAPRGALPAAPPEAMTLEEVIVVSRLEAPAVETAEIGAKKVTADDVRHTPALLGEADVIKALQTLPGVTEGTEGLAGMNVHGGNADENLYMLDNVPIYQVNHFAGLFSAFNPEIIRYIDFFKSSIPAKYDGRLSSVMDVRLLNGNIPEGHHGSARLGLTSGAFNIGGPIGSRTNYLVGVRRSWFDVLTIPALALINSGESEKTRFHYYFMDLNGKVSHRFSARATAFVSIYFGDDMLKTGTKDEGFDGDPAGYAEDDRYDFHWGNLVAQAGLNYRLSHTLSAEFTAAYTRCFSKMRHHDIYKIPVGSSVSTTDDLSRTENNINDWIFRADFDWQAGGNSRVRFGAGYVRHSFLPARTTRISIVNEARTETRDSTWAYGANEFNAYIEDDWKISDHLRVNAGLHGSLFAIDGRVKHGISPRLSVSYRPWENVAVKAAYSHMVQYVHQLSQSYLALPTDQWIPVTGNFKPQGADKIAAGAYWQTADNSVALSVEGYYKWMHNLIDYTDEYYLKPPLEMWNARLTAGSGTAKGIDVKIERTTGRITGHISYSLAWTDRRFAGKNGGHPYPARFDNRHTVNILIGWRINDKVRLNASWTGHSGNRFTLMSQMWETPAWGSTDGDYSDEAPLRAPLNNYRLPFYHRLDVSITVRNRRGYWTFGLYNAYNHRNTIAINRGYKDVMETGPYGAYITSRPVFRKVKLLPVIPSISYTWQF